MVNRLLLAASVLILAGLAMLSTPGPGWPMLLAGVAVLLLAVAARVASRS